MALHTKNPSQSSGGFWVMRAGVMRVNTVQSFSV